MSTRRSTAVDFRRREARTAWLFLGPVLLVVGLFVLLPVLGTLHNSLFRDVSFMPRTFIGFGNYAEIVSQPRFLTAVRFTLLFTVTAVALETLLGMSFALVLNEAFPGRGALRTIMLIPWAIPTIVSAKTWKLIFDYTYGVLNYLVVTFGLSADKVNWLGSAPSAFAAIVVAEVWKTTPFMVIILLAGLQAVPRELHKQARVDGAGIGRRFFAVTLPIIRPVVIIALIFRTIDSLRIFDLIYVLTGGGPGGSTASLSILGFRYFTDDRFGMGSAVSVITFLVAFGVSLVYLKVGRFRESIG